MRTNQANQPTKNMWFLCLDEMMLDLLAHEIYGLVASTEFSWVLESMSFMSAYVTDGQICGVFRGARNLYLPTLHLHSDHLLKEDGWPNWQLHLWLLTCGYQAVISTFSMLTCHINKKNTLLPPCRWFLGKNGHSWRLGFNSSCRSWWICLLQSFSSWSSITWPGAGGSRVLLFVTFFLGGIPGYHCGIIDFAEDNSNVTKSFATCFNLSYVWISIFFFFLDHWSIDLSDIDLDIDVCKLLECLP